MPSSRPSSSIAVTIAHSSRRETGSTPTEGSSSSSRRGRDSSAQASPSFCFIPPDNFPASRAVNGARPVKRSSLATRSARSARRHGVQIGEQVEVLRDGQVLIQTETLRHVADHRVRRGRIARHVVAEHGDASGRWAQQSGDQAQQRGLAGGVRPDQPGDDARLDRCRNAIQRQVRGRAARRGEGVPQPLDRDQRYGHANRPGDRPVGTARWPCRLPGRPQKPPEDRRGSGSATLLAARKQVVGGRPEPVLGLAFGRTRGPAMTRGGIAEKSIIRPLGIIRLPADGSSSACPAARPSPGRSPGCAADRRAGCAAPAFRRSSG